jgi:hypothetical protein
MPARLVLVFSRRRIEPCVLFSPLDVVRLAWLGVVGGVEREHVAA